MGIVLPPTIQVRQYLRHQRQRKKAYRDWFDAVFERDWKDGKLTGRFLRDFAISYQAELSRAGAFEIKHDGTADLLLLKTDRAFVLESRALWPIGLGSRILDAEEAYAEEALMLQRLKFEFSKKKVATSEAPLNFGLTRHCLERLIERGAMTVSLEVGLPAVVSQLAADAALCLANGIAKVRDDDNWARGAFIPYRGGLIVLTNRLLAGPLYAQDFGWRFSFTKRHYIDGYLKKDLISLTAHGVNGGAIVSVWFATTFLSQEQLGADQLAYVNAFESWREKVSAEVLKFAFDAQFNPDYIYRSQRLSKSVEDAAECHVENLTEMVQRDAFKLHAREGLAELVEADRGTAAFRSHVRKRVERTGA